MSVTAELVAFLTARYDEEEDAARIAAATPDAAQNITRWHPAHVLADIAAKRAIVEEHTCQCPDPDCGDCGACSGYHHADPTPAPCTTLRLLVQPYAERPDFDPQWRAA
jgi:hypothetical protein